MKTRSEVFQFEKELKWEHPAPGIRRQIMGYDGQLMMVKVEFEKRSGPVRCMNITTLRLPTWQVESLN